MILQHVLLTRRRMELTRRKQWLARIIVVFELAWQYTFEQLQSKTRFNHFYVIVAMRNAEFQDHWLPFTPPFTSHLKNFANNSSKSLICVIINLDVYDHSSHIVLFHRCSKKQHTYYMTKKPAHICIRKHAKTPKFLLPHANLIS